MSDEKTRVGNYFISNYPPFSQWSPERRDAVDAALATAPSDERPLGLYVHLPFCRKRCDFCYFKVYTDQSSGDIRRYLDALLAEAAAFAQTPYLAGRPLDFVYFGGGTPSFLSEPQLRELFAGLAQCLPLDAAQEVAFECEPGTLQRPKIQALAELGVTRLSIGVENFDPKILELNNRAHRAEEIYRVFEFARECGFTQVNIDLIAGMVGETPENWTRCVDETLGLAPESVTVYQMEVPYNTTLYASMQDGGEEVAPVADWQTKRAMVGEAFAALEQRGYRVGSAYTAALPEVQFRYRDALWRGADMLGLGVSSFSHLGGVHFQNEPSLNDYIAAVERGGRAVQRAMALSDEERFVREWILQLKLGRVEAAYFQTKFGIDPRERFASVLAEHQAAGWLQVTEEGVAATREGLLRIDSLLPDFFAQEYQHARYA